MVTSIVLIEAIPQKIQLLTEQIVDIPGVSEVYSVSGRYDIVVIIRVNNNEQLARVASEYLNQLEGVKSTETMLAFQALSHHDLENLFGLGF
jgi:DNA-binding Lrp family transcriptional regulator